MKIFVTGASGFIGSALVPQLMQAGHSVLGLARSDESADALIAAGASVQRGSLDDLESLEAGAKASDGVIHLAFKHDFSDFAGASQADARAIEALGDALQNTGKPLVVAFGVLGAPHAGELITENDPITTTFPPPMPRMVGAMDALKLAERGVRSSVIRLSPMVHDRTKAGFATMMIGIARAKGVSGYIGDGAQRWPAVHVIDAARLFLLAAENAAPGTLWNAVAEEGVTVRSIAEIIGQRLGLPVRSIDAADAPDHFGFLSNFLGLDSPASSTITQQTLDWQPDPSHAGLLGDLENGEYFRALGGILPPEHDRNCEQRNAI